MGRVVRRRGEEMEKGEEGRGCAGVGSEVGRTYSEHGTHVHWLDRRDGSIRITLRNTALADAQRRARAITVLTICA